MICQKVTGDDGWNECRYCSALWYGKPKRCYSMPVPVWRPSGTLLIAGAIIWLAIGTLVYWRFF